MYSIRVADISDFNGIWPIFNAVVTLGDTYSYDVNTDKQEAYRLWMGAPRKTYVVEHGAQIVATYYIKTNQNGPGKHVCNCGYMVDRSVRGQGLATMMCQHSQGQARLMGYEAMQFNFVAASNDGAVRLWLKLGFKEVGRAPRAFNHPQKGMVDALIMHKFLI